MPVKTAEPILLAGRPVLREEIIEIRSPYDNKVVGAVCYANAEDAEEACAAAVHAFSETRKLSSWRRAEVLAKVADLLVQQTEEIASVIVQEAGKPLKDARAEIGRAIITFRVAAEEAKRIEGTAKPADWIPGTEGKLALSRRFPIGPILGITPFNFPMNLVAHKVAPAIASGNPIIIKPAPQTPLTALYLGRLVVEAGWPAEAISVLPCSNDVAGILLQDERIKMLSFTGSAAIGWKLKQLVPQKRVTLELGGNAAVIVCADGDVELAAKKILVGGYTYAGQSCISVQRVYAHTSVKDKLLSLLEEGLRLLTVDNPKHESTQMGSMISIAAAERVESWIVEAVAEGATLHAGGGRSGAILAPSLLSDVPDTVMLCREEAFAPVVFVNGFNDLDEAITATNASTYGLQAAIFTRSWPAMAKVWSELEVGAILVDESSAWRADQLPYGGVKNSGVGKEGVESAIEEMTESRMLILTA